MKLTLLLISLLSISCPQVSELNYFERGCAEFIPRTVSKLEFRLRQSPGVRATQRGPYCINTDLFAIDRTAGAFALSKFQFSNGSGYSSLIKKWNIELDSFLYKYLTISYLCIKKTNFNIIKLSDLQNKQKNKIKQMI